MYENQTTGHIANALFPQSNAHLAALAIAAKPKDDLTLKGEYFAFWWAKSYQEGDAIYSSRGDAMLMHERSFAAQEIDLTAIYDYTEDVQFALMGGCLIPGPAFDKANNTLASEVIGSMKVSF